VYQKKLHTITTRRPKKQLRATAFCPIGRNRTSLYGELPERTLLFKQSCRLTHLDNMALLHDDDQIIVYDGRDSMCDSQDRRVIKVIPDSVLYIGIRLGIDRRRRL
jgi:hypothetical protein